MFTRRVVVWALAATAAVGAVVGGAVGLLGGGGGSGGSAQAATGTNAPSGTPQRTTPPTIEAHPPVSAGPTTPATRSSKPSTSPPASASTRAPQRPPMSPGHTYVLAAGGRLALDVAGEAKRDKAPVIMYPPGANKANQRWKVSDAGGGYVRLKAQNSGKCLQMSGDKGGHAVQGDCGRNGTQLWRPVRSGSGVVLYSHDGQALGPGPKIGANQGLGLVPSAVAAVWILVPVD